MLVSVEDHDAVEHEIEARNAIEDEDEDERGDKRLRTGQPKTISMRSQHFFAVTAHGVGTQQQADEFA